MEFARHNLSDDQRHKQREKNDTTNQISRVDHDVGLEPGHGDRVTEGLAQRRVEDLDDPEAKCDLWHFAVGDRSASILHNYDLSSVRRGAPLLALLR